MSEPTKPRDWFLIDMPWETVYDPAKIAVKQAPEDWIGLASIHVREVSPEMDAAVEYMKRVLEDYAKLLRFGSTARMALEAYDTAVKRGAV